MLRGRRDHDPLEPERPLPAAPRLALAPDTEKRRQHGEAAEEAHQHAGPGDQAQLAHRLVVGRDEHVEADGGGDGAEHEGASDAPR